MFFTSNISAVTPAGYIPNTITAFPKYLQIPSAISAVAVPLAASSGSSSYILTNATCDPNGFLAADDNFEIILNGVLVYSGLFPNNTRPALNFSANPGDSLQIIMWDQYPGACADLGWALISVCTNQCTLDYWYIQFSDLKGIRHKESSGSADHRVALKLLADKKAAVLTGKLFFDNSPMKEKILFKDFIKEGVRVYAGTDAGGYTPNDAEILLGGDFAAKRKLKFELEAVERTGKRPRFKFRSLAGRFKYLAMWIEVFGDLEVKDIDFDTVTKQLEKFRRPSKRYPDGRKGGTTNAMVSILKTFYDNANTSSLYLKKKFQSPILSAIHRKKSRRLKPHYMTEEERRLYLEIGMSFDNKWVYPATLIMDMSEFLWLTGFRDATVTDRIKGLKVGQFQMDLGNFGVINLKDIQAKGDRPETVRLRTARAREIVLKHLQGKGPDEYLFQWSEHSKTLHSDDNVDYTLFNDAFRQVTKKAGIQNIRLHDFRKTYAMDRMIGVYEKSAEIGDVQMELFHKSSVTTEGYIDRGIIYEERQKRGLN